MTGSGLLCFPIPKDVLQETIHVGLFVIGIFTAACQMQSESDATG